jgi:hypothetical protein
LITQSAEVEEEKKRRRKKTKRRKEKERNQTLLSTFYCQFNVYCCGEHRVGQKKSLYLRNSSFLFHNLLIGPCHLYLNHLINDLSDLCAASLLSDIYTSDMAGR